MTDRTIMTKTLTHFEILESVYEQMNEESTRNQFWIESIAMTIESLTQNKAKFEVAVKQQNTHELAHASHKLLGTLGFVGVSELCQRLLAIQNDCQTETITWPLSDFDSIMNQMSEVLTELEAVRMAPRPKKKL